MDIDALIAAAKAIDRKMALKEKRVKRLEELTGLVATAHARGVATREYQGEYRALSMAVVTFGDEINDLRAALRKRPRKKKA